MNAKRKSSPPRTARESGVKDNDCCQAADVVGLGTCTVNYEALVPKLGWQMPKVLSQGFEVAPGGATALSLIQLARLGVSTAWLGILGDDVESDMILETFEDEGISTTCIEKREGQRSPFSWVAVTPKGDRGTIVFPNVLNYLTPEKVGAAMVGCIDSSLHFHTDVASVPLHTTLQAIEVARAADCFILTDIDTEPTYLVEEAGLGRHKELEAILKKSDVVKSCLAAATALTGAGTPDEACRILHTTYESRYTVVTAGREGSFLMYNGEGWEIPALGPKAVDPTGAGGAYFGGLSYALLRGLTGEQAGYFAAACAAYTCSRVGSLALGTLEEIDVILNGTLEVAGAEDDGGE